MRRYRKDPTEWSGEIYASESMELCLDPVRVCMQDCCQVHVHQARPRRGGIRPGRLTLTIEELSL